MTQPDFDIGIIGGGPAGASMGAYLARAGLSCVVFERELFPRPHVGESLVPSSTRVFRDLDFLEVMEREKFPRKYGAAWTASHSNRLYEHDWEDMTVDGLEVGDYADFKFKERQQAGVDQNYTYHVDRGKFDLLLLQHANQSGAAVYEGIRVEGADFSDPDEVTVNYKMGRRDCKTTVRMLVDATGRNTLIGNQLGWKIKDPVFDQYALHTWFEDYDRSVVSGGDDKDDYIYIHFLPVSNSWMWQIPITDKITSIGVVTQKSNFAKRRTEHEPFFWEMVDTRPEFGAALRQGERIRPFRTEGDYSYAMKQIVGDRLVLVGDAGRFVDPIFSTGVSIALNSSRFAKNDILAAFESGDFSASAFQTYADTLRRGTKNWHEFITVYYRLNVLFTAFVRDPRYRIDVLKLLQGDVYDEDEPEVLARMKEIVREIEQNPKHLWHGLLNDLTSNAFAPQF